VEQVELVVEVRAAARGAVGEHPQALGRAQESGVDQARPRSRREKNGRVLAMSSYTRAKRGTT